MRSLYRCSIPGLGLSLVSTADGRKSVNWSILTQDRYLIAMVSTEETTEVQVRVTALIVDNNTSRRYPVSCSSPASEDKASAGERIFLTWISWLSSTTSKSPLM